MRAISCLENVNITLLAKSACLPAWVHGIFNVCIFKSLIRKSKGEK